MVYAWECDDKGNKVMFQIIIAGNGWTILFTTTNYEEAVKVVKKYENSTVIAYVYNANDVLFTRSFPEDKDIKGGME
jgi:hypothetical protein